MSIFTTIAKADQAITAADEARGTYATDMAQGATVYAMALYPKGTSNERGRKTKAVQMAWDDAKAEYVAAGASDDAARKAVQRLGQVALIIAANPKKDGESDEHFHARILRARTLVMGGDSALIAAAIAGETVAPKKRAPRTPSAPGTPEPGTPEPGTPGTPEPVAPIAPIDALADALAAYVTSSHALLDALKACDDAKVRVPKARKSLAEVNARLVLEAMTA